jgi:uridine phosphorylase
MKQKGPVLSVNHGMGCPSMSILLSELLKLIHYAKCKDVTFFRMGTSGGLGVEPGTVILTTEAVDGKFRPEYHQIILGNEVSRDTKCDQSLINELLEIGKTFENKDGIQKVIAGKTMCAHDFYEGQGRVDGPHCDYTVNDKMNYLKVCRENGVANIEMESLCFAGMLSRAKIRGAIVCVTLLDRLSSDQVNLSHELSVEYQERPFKVVGHYIKEKLKKSI